MITTPDVRVDQADKGMPIELSTRHLAILNFIYDERHITGHSPSLREIGQGVGITSTSHISYHIHRLMGWGYLGRTPTIWRSLFLTEKGYTAIGKQPEDDPNLIINKLRDENRRLREWCERLHRERDNLHDELHGLRTQAG